MLKFAIIAAGSASGSALATALLLRYSPTRRLLKLMQIGVIVAVAAYVASFFVFYRPEVWLPVALEIVTGVTRLNTDLLTGLGGTAAGTLFAQMLVARRTRK